MFNDPKASSFMTDLEELVTVSDDHSRHDVMYADHDSNKIVRRLLKLYY